MKGMLGTMLVLGLAALLAAPVLGAEVVRKGGKTFILDPSGEAWDITQAAARGFDPQGFERGLGREAIKPLDQENVRSPDESVPGHLRVIGISAGDSSLAVSVRRLARHRVANVTIGGEAVAPTY